MQENRGLTKFKLPHTGFAWCSDTWSTVNCNSVCEKEEGWETIAIFKQQYLGDPSIDILVKWDLFIQASQPI